MMDRLLSLLQEYTHGVAASNPIAMQNLEAASADADDIALALDRREGHREFSMFTPDQGKA